MKLDEFIDTRKMTITRLADDIGYSRTHLTEVLNGRKRPGKKLIKALMQATNGKANLEGLLNAYKDRHQNK
jgi:DNA transposition AAA+ family ATPase